jgi:hypothetical protein
VIVGDLIPLEVRIGASLFLTSKFSKGMAEAEAEFVIGPSLGDAYPFFGRNPIALLRDVIAPPFFLPSSPSNFPLPLPSSPFWGRGG